MGEVEQLILLFIGALTAVRDELALFSIFWIIVGLADELVLDACYFGLRLAGRAQTGRLPARNAALPLHGRAAVFIPTWQEAVVVGTTLREALRAWPHPDLRIYVGCYPNDAPTVAAVLASAQGDPRVRLVINDRPGPTTKADCLNRLYAALCADERRAGQAVRSVILHDAEDMVHPGALVAIDQALDEVDFVQLPVLPEPNPRSPWIAGHYTDEFAEAHGKLLVVRTAMGGAIPAAGVGCGFSRAALGELARERGLTGEAGPFEAQCLTEDYELGLRVSRQGRGGRFLRMRADDGTLIATRSYFPAELVPAVRQKTRWIHGIAFQSWDRLGWQGRPFDIWMALRDRRGPLTALVLTCAYVLLLLELVLHLADWTGLAPLVPLAPAVRTLLLLTFAGLVWRMALRCLFVWREYGMAEGLRAVLRLPIGNVIAIMAGRRALLAYLRALRGEGPQWDKTLHFEHPAQRRPGILAAARP
jgi:adsorption protein B